MRDVDPATLPERMRSAPRVAALIEAAHEEDGLWLVGGAVRDLLLGGDPKDLDVLVEGDALAVADRMGARLGGEVEATGRFDTATVRAREVAFDLARARTETYPLPGALPEVAPATLEEDLPRRDFTVNALAAALAAERLGQLRAPAGALDDLRGAVLRVFHPGSFRDDPTRLLRLARLAARLSFAPDDGTAALAREAIAAGALQTVSGPRLGAELRLLARDPAALPAARCAQEGGVLVSLHPSLHLDERLTARALALLPSPLVLVASLARGFERGELLAWLDGLGFEAGDRDAIAAAALDAPVLAAALGAARRPSEIAFAARGRPDAGVALAGALGAEEASAGRGRFTPAVPPPGALGAEGAARRWLEELRHVRLEIGGADLVAAGVSEGPVIGRALGAALRAKLDGEARGREEELRAALSGLEAS
ncbi:MAG: hypothetical protein ACR2ML_05250 [Solirubrobacteraceae bacterium]